MFNEAKHEKKNYEYLYKYIDSESLEKRIRISLEFYIKRATWYKDVWTVTTIFSIVLPAAATFSSAAFSGSVAVPLITALTTICTGLMAAFKLSDKKTAYRDSAEKIKSAVSEYIENKSADSEKKLAKNIEKIITDEKAKIEALEKTN